MRTESIEEADDVRDEMRYLTVDLIEWNHIAWPRAEVCKLRKTMSESPNLFVRAAIHDEMGILQDAIADIERLEYLTTKSRTWLARRAHELRETIGSHTEDPMEQILWNPYYSISGAVRKAELRADVSSLEASLSRLGDLQKAPADLARLERLRERFRTFEENEERYKFIHELCCVDAHLSGEELQEFEKALSANHGSVKNAAPASIAHLEQLRKRFKAFEEDEDPIRDKLQCNTCSVWKEEHEEEFVVVDGRLAKNGKGRCRTCAFPECGTCDRTPEDPLSLREINHYIEAGRWYHGDTAPDADPYTLDPQTKTDAKPLDLRPTDIQTPNSQTLPRQTHRQTDRQTDRQTEDRQTDRPSILDPHTKVLR